MACIYFEPLLILPNCRGMGTQNLECHLALTTTLGFKRLLALHLNTLALDHSKSMWDYDKKVSCSLPPIPYPSSPSSSRFQNLGQTGGSCWNEILAFMEPAQLLLKKASGHFQGNYKKRNKGHSFLISELCSFP